MNISTQKALLNQLFMIAKTAQIHDAANDAFIKPLTTLKQLIQEVVDVESTLKIESIENGIFLNGKKVRVELSTYTASQFFIKLFSQKQTNGVLFDACPETPELTAFLKLFLSSWEKDISGVDALNGLLESNNIVHISLLPLSKKKSVASDNIDKKINLKQRALQGYAKTVSLFKEIDGVSQDLTKSKIFSQKMKRMVCGLVDICLEEGFSFFGLSNIKSYDEYTFNHSVNVCVIAIAFAKNLGLSKAQLGELGVAALFHDYGKVDIPKHILNKPGKFDDEEWKVMRSHPIQSVKKLLALNGFQVNEIRRMIAAYEHHRNFDSSGYPNTGLKKPMNFYSKVVAIADAYDAMTTNRVYQRGMTAPAALKILQEHMGTKFDPLLVKAFINTVGVYPVGTLLKLNTGELAVVYETHTDPKLHARPKIRIIRSKNGQAPSPIPEWDLADNSLQSIQIQGVAHPQDYHINIAHYLFGDVLSEIKQSSRQSNPSASL